MIFSQDRLRNSWTLRKSKFFLDYATDSEVRRNYEYSLGFDFVILGVPIMLIIFSYLGNHINNYSQILPLGLFMVAIVFLLRVQYVFWVVAGQWLLYALGLEVFNNGYYFGGFFLFIEAFYISSVFVTKIYLRGFDNKYFDNVYHYLEEDSVIEDFKKNICRNRIIVFYFEYVLLGGFISFISLAVRPYLDSHRKYQKGFISRSTRSIILYSILIKVTPGLFDKKDLKKFFILKPIVYLYILYSVIVVICSSLVFLALAIGMWPKTLGLLITAFRATKDDKKK